MALSTTNETASGNIHRSPSFKSNKDSNSAEQQLDEIHQRNKKKKRTPEEELARLIVPKLASRAYHLPGYNVLQDWFQYLFNNHPLLGICCHHRFHPLTTRQRLIILLGSFAFGVAMTNAIYLWFIGSGRDETRQVFAVNVVARESSAHTISATSGVLTLLTVGSGSNALFDRFVWSLSACGCCRAGGRCERRGCCRNLGARLVCLLVVVVVALTSCIVVARASMEEGQRTVPLLQNRTAEAVQDLLDFRGFVDDFDADDYSFLKGYALEYLVSSFVFYPLLQTLFFSGILGCGSVPVFGGRPYSMKQEAKRQAELPSVCPTEEA